MNTNPKAKRILCYGASNTWGYIPDTDHERFPANVRWPGVLQDSLGSNFEIIEEGLNSRTLVKEDPRPGKEGRSGIVYLKPCLDTHDPLDIAVFLLGTNELKYEFNLSPEEIGQNLSKILDLTKKKVKNIIVVVPPIVDETQGANTPIKYKGGHEKSLALKKVFKQVVEQHGVQILDIQEELEIGADGIHLVESAHKLLGQSLANLIQNIH